MTRRLHLRGALALVGAMTCASCGQSPITPARVEGSIGPTFANLVQVQVSWMGLTPMTASDVAVSATCRKLMTGDNSGSGEWTCVVVWKGPDRQTLSDTYDLFVATDGCYTATVASENMGGPTLRAKDGNEVRNLLYAFEGCFDTT